MAAPYCRECGTTSTPLWRYGPEGSKSLCNACGIKWKRALRGKKTERKRKSSSDDSHSGYSSAETIEYGPNTVSPCVDPTLIACVEEALSELRFEGLCTTLVY